MGCRVVEASHTIVHGTMEDDCINIVKSERAENSHTEEARFSPTRSPSLEEEESSTIYSVVRVEALRSIEDRGMSAATLVATKAANGTRSASFIPRRQVGVGAAGECYAERYIERATIITRERGLKE